MGDVVPIAFATRTACAGCASQGELLDGAWINVSGRMHRAACPEAQAHLRGLRFPDGSLKYPDLIHG